MITSEEKSRIENSCYLVYRGSLERSRLAFILEAILGRYEKVFFVWIYPGKLTEKVQGTYDEFITAFALEKKEILNHRLSDFFLTRKAVHAMLRGAITYDLALVGSTASLFAHCFSPGRSLWFINGIPEEAALDHPIKGFFLSKFQWWLYTKSIKPDLIVTVSKRMSVYVTRHFPNVKITAVPTCVDISTFLFDGNAAQKRTGIFAYLGTGAAWQALDKLSVLWQAIHQKDPSIRFRVISRDPRCRVLSDGINPSAIEFVQSNDFVKVAGFLHEAEVGFLIRKDSVVNRVSFPTKLAEYLAAGCWVVASELDWDVTDYFNEYSIGFKAPPDLNAEQLSESILGYRNKIDWENQYKSVKECASVLDRKHWLNKLSSILH